MNKVLCAVFIFLLTLSTSCSSTEPNDKTSTETKVFSEATNTESKKTEVTKPSEEGKKTAQDTVSEATNTESKKTEVTKPSEEVKKIEVTKPVVKTGSPVEISTKKTVEKSQVNIEEPKNIESAKPSKTEVPEPPKPSKIEVPEPVKPTVLEPPEIKQSSDTVKVGQTTVYLITLKNRTSTIYHKLRVKLTVPDEMKITSIDTPINFDTTTRIFNPIPAFKPGHEAKFKVEVRASQEGTVIFKVSLTADELQQEYVVEKTTQIIP